MTSRNQRKAGAGSTGRIPIACLWLAAGCSLVTSESDRAAELRARNEVLDQVRTLRNLVDVSSSVVGAIGRSAADSTDDLALKRATVAYRQRFLDEAMRALWTDPPMLGLLDIWALVLQFRVFAAEAIEGPPVPGEALAQADRLRVELEKEMQRILGDRFGTAKATIEKFATDRPIQAGFIRIAVTSSMLEDSSTGGLFSWIPEFKLNPFDSVGEGLGESAQAIETVSRAVERFTDIAHLLPLQLAWQLEMFKYDLDADRKFDAITTGFEETARAANAAVASIDAAPERIRKEVVSALDDIDPKLVEVRATLADVTRASESLTPMARSFEMVATSLDAMAAQLDVTLRTFNQTYILLDGDPDAPPPPPDAPSGHPFDVREFDAAGQSLGAMAAQLQQTLDSFNQLLRDPSLTARIGEASGTAESTVKSIAWTLVGSVLALAGGIALVLLGYRRFARPRA